MTLADKAAQHYEKSLSFDASHPGALLRLAELAARRTGTALSAMPDVRSLWGTQRMRRPPDSSTWSVPWACSTLKGREAAAAVVAAKAVNIELTSEDPASIHDLVRGRLQQNHEPSSRRFSKSWLDTRPRHYRNARLRCEPAGAHTALGLGLVPVALFVRPLAMLHIGPNARKKAVVVEKLIYTGPYELTRNPLYIANIAAYTGVGLATTGLVGGTSAPSSRASTIR